MTCRFDWHQTASAVTISVYAKIADPTKTTVEVNKVTAKLNIVFDAGNCYFNKSFILRGVCVLLIPRSGEHSSAILSYKMYFFLHIRGYVLLWFVSLVARFY